MLSFQFKPTKPAKSVRAGLPLQKPSSPIHATLQDYPLKSEAKPQTPELMSLNSLNPGTNNLCNTSTLTGSPTKRQFKHHPCRTPPSQKKTWSRCSLSFGPLMPKPLLTAAAVGSETPTPTWRFTGSYK